VTDDQVKELIRYFDDFVCPTIKDFAKKPASVRHAFLACVVTFHTVDYLAHPRTKGVKRALQLQQYAHKCPDFKIVDDVANAFKHVVRGSREGDLKAGQVESEPAPHHADLTFFGGADPNEPPLRLDRPRGRVVLATDPNVDVLDTVMRAATFLRSKVPKKG
jgi:hypothetical protein